jgi:hypothetical protein
LSPLIKSHVIKEIIRIKSLLPLSSKNLFLELKEKGPLFVILVLCLPFLQPIPIPIISTLIALIISIQSWAFLKKSTPILLKKWEEFEITEERFLFIERGAQRVIPILNHFIKERISYLFDIILIRFISGITLILLSLFLALPLPIPSSNLIPAIGIFSITISHLERDGVFLLLSYCYSFLIFGLIIFGFIFIF